MPTEPSFTRGSGAASHQDVQSRHDLGLEEFRRRTGDCPEPDQVVEVVRIAAIALVLAQVDGERVVHAAPPVRQGNLPLRPGRAPREPALAGRTKTLTLSEADVPEVAAALARYAAAKAELDAAAETQLVGWNPPSLIWPRRPERRPGAR